MKPKNIIPLKVEKAPEVETKAVRFVKLVEESGQPEVVTLWADPEKDKQFMGFVKGGRVLTLVQKPAGTKKDFGVIGFHPQPFATFLVFPKPLKLPEGTYVLGIKYEMLTPMASEREFTPRVLPPKTALKPIPVVPVEKKFVMKIVRTLKHEISFETMALNLTEAKKKALAQAKDEPLPPDMTVTKIGIRPS